MRFIIKWILTAIILGVVAFLTPGFTTNGFLTLLGASIVIALLNTVIYKFVLGENAKVSSFTSFIVSVVVLLITGHLIEGFHITVIGAIIASILIGLLDVIGYLRK